MADETSQPQAGAQDSEPQGAGTAPTVEELSAQVADLQAKLDKAVSEGRKHEDREKANRDKARKADELEAQASTDAERIKALEDEVNGYKAREARNALVTKVADATGVPADVVALLAGGDEDTLTKAAAVIARLAQPGAPKAPTATASTRPAKRERVDIVKRGARPERDAEALAAGFHGALKDAGF